MLRAVSKHEQLRVLGQSASRKAFKHPPGMIGPIIDKKNNG
jgi:hypothetical protein